jgi:two-component system, OmpR family, response regulator RegX3
MATHILIADNDALHTKMLTFLLAEHGYVVEVVASPGEISAAMQRYAVDLIVVKSASRDQRSLLMEVRRQSAEIPIILVSTVAGFKDEVAALDGGADDVIAVPYEPAVLLARVGAVLRRYGRGERSRDGAVVTVGGTHLDLGRLTFTTPTGRAVLVTPTEMRILECLMRAPQSVVAREKLIDEVWGYESASANNRVDVYMRRLRQKIEAHPKDRNLIETVRGVGYLYRGDEQDYTSTAKERTRARSTHAAWAAA